MQKTIATEIDSPREDLGYKQPEVSPKIQYAREVTANVLKFCKIQDHDKSVNAEREGLRELHRLHPGRGYDQVLRTEKRFHENRQG